MMGKKATRQRLIVSALIGAVLLIPACSGGGVSVTPPGTSNLEVTGTVTNLVDTGTGQEILCINFTVTGIADQAFNLAFDYQDNTLPSPAFASMSEITSATEALFGVTSESGITFSPGTGTVSASFYWAAGTDLGFVGSGNLTLRVTPSNGGTPSGQTLVPLTVSGISYNGGNLPQTTTGSNLGPSGSTAGRTDHAAHEVGGGDNVLVVGGIDGSLVAADTVDRLNIDPNLLTHTNQFSAATADRVGHASTFFFDGTGNLQILVTGGVSSGGGDVATADVYGFSPTESLTAAANMGTARSGHCATWLPDNTVLITGGNTSASSVEIYDPATGTFSAAAPMPSGLGRAGHTCCLLPNGQVLVAGGRNPGALTTALPALLFDMASGTWTNTGTTIDRYQHTASLLVNGVCYLVGGRTVTTGVVLGTAHAYRTFADSIHPSGFSATQDNLTEPRAQHATARLGTGDLLVTGGFDGGAAPANTLATAEVFLPKAFTSSSLGAFSSVADMTDSRARHSTTTTGSGLTATIGGVSGNETTFSVLDTVEIHSFNNTAPVVSNVAVGSGGNLADVSITFDLADAEGDRSFCFVRFSTDGGSSYSFATLNDYAATVNLSSGSITLNWNAGADGVTSGSVIIEVRPVGGILGAAASATATL